MAKPGMPSPVLDDYLYWQERLAGRDASGLSIDEFCVDEGVSRSTFYRWVRRLKAGIPKAVKEEGASLTLAEMAEPKFLPISVTASTFLAALSPGNSPAAVSFGGNVDLTSTATLNIELGGTTPGTQYDQLHVAGSLALGGALNVVLDTGFQPVLGNSFDILDWPSGQLTGSFSSLQLPKLNGAEAWNTSQLYTIGVLSVVPTYLPGDVNRDGVVNVADISALMTALANISKYRSDNSLTDPTLFKDVADVNQDGNVNNLDIQSLITLVANNSIIVNGGAEPGSELVGDASAAGAPQVNAVPEPATIVLLGVGALAFAFRRSSP